MNIVIVYNIMPKKMIIHTNPHVFRTKLQNIKNI